MRDPILFSIKPTNKNIQAPPTRTDGAESDKDLVVPGNDVTTKRFE